MGFAEKPPMLTGQANRDLTALRDYLFRMAGSLDEVMVGVPKETAKTASSSGKDEAMATEKALRQRAQELKSLIIKTADEVYSYADSKTEEFASLYVAKSEYGEFTETMQSRIETTAQGVVESYDYGSLIQSAQDSLGLLQEYITSIDGEIRRGIVLDPDTGEYVTGIAISQKLTFTGACAPTDAHNPGDGFTYYYLTQGQTFGLYTSTGWQFWIDGYKRGWFNSVDGTLHVGKVHVEDSLRIGGHWQIRQAGQVLEFTYLPSQ